MLSARTMRSFTPSVILALLLATACAKGEAGGSKPADSSVTSTSAGSAGTPSAAQPATNGSGVAAQIPGVSVTTGVYTLTQAARGQEVYASTCAQCHTTGQHSGTQFAAAWNNRRLSDLYDIVHNTMPQDNPGSLSEQDYIDVVAYMLQINRIPAGKIDLRADAAALRDLRIDVNPAAAP